MEKIRQLKAGKISLRDILQQQALCLRSEAKNAAAKEAFCKELEDIIGINAVFNVDDLLRCLEEKEKGGTLFVDVQQQDITKKMAGALISAFVTSLLSLAWIALAVYMYICDDMPIGIFILFIVIAALFIGLLGIGVFKDMMK